MRQRQIADWLNALGMPEYIERFAENGVDLAVLPDLTDHDLEKLGVLLGHRRRMSRAVAELRRAEPAAQPSATKPMPQDHAERRHLTLMFCDLVGSTALSTRLDPEELQGVIRTYHQRCGEVIAKYDGFVAKYFGDGVLAYFGYPQAHEDDAERAVHAGLALTEAIARLDLGAATALRARVGVATGLVVVGEELIGKGETAEPGVAGVTPNLAARLQALAEPDAVIIDGNTRLLLGELFEFRAIGPVSIKGFSEPVAIWQVLGKGDIDSRFEALRTTTTPLVGRQEEIDRLMTGWRQAERGNGCVVLISGEPGIGKSRLVQTVLDRLKAEPHNQLLYFCSSHHQDSALYPVIAQFARDAGFRREDSAEARLKKLEAVLTRSASNLVESIPPLAALLSIPTGDRYPSLNLSPQKQKEKTLAALLGQIEGLAARAPVLLVLEDAQWADPTALELFDLVVDRSPSLPIMVLATLRPDFARPWADRPNVTMLSLNRLSHRQRADMIAHLTGGKRLPQEIADQIIDRTDGVPLFVEELTKAVIESDMLTDDGDSYAMTGPSPALAIPTTLNASLLARLDRLAPVREVAQIAAALGRSFSHELISATAAMPRQRLEDALSQLVSTELIFRRGNPPNAEYTFKHALVQDAAYNTLLRSNRRQLHGRIATILEAKFPEVAEAQPEVLARHYFEAGLIAKAAGYWLRAGKQAIARGAMTEAVAQLRKALDKLAVAPDSAAYREHELNLQISLGHALLATKGYAAPEPGDAFARARELCDQLGRPPQFGPVLIGQFTLRCVRGELGQAQHHAEEIRRLGEAGRNSMWKCFGSSASGCVCSFLGNFSDAHGYFEEYLSLWDPKYRAFVGTPGDGYVTILSYLSRTLLCLGHLDQARMRRDQALAEARRLSPFNVVFAQCNAWYADLAIHGVNTRATMAPAVDEVSTISAENGFTLYTGIGKFMQGWRLGVTGRPDDGIPALLQGIAVLRTTGTKLNLPFFLMTLAEVYGVAGRPEQGLEQLSDAVKMVAETQERWAEAEMMRLRGTLYASMHDFAAAEDSYLQALALARRQNANFWTLRAARDLARLWRDQGKVSDALDLLSPVYASFKEGLETPVLQDVKTLLTQLA